MTLPAEWPFDMPSVLAERYEEAAETLYCSDRRKQGRTIEVPTHFGRDLDLYTLALSLAVGECEKARQYTWSELADHTRRQQWEREWDSAASAARKLANTLEKADGAAGAFIIGRAATQSGIDFKSNKRRSYNQALADFLRAMSKQRVKWVRGAGRYPLGGLWVERVANERTHMPSKTTVLTICLTHLFRRLSECHPRGDFDPEAKLEICIGEPLATGGNPFWNVAARFAQAALDTDQRDLAVSAQKWLQRHKSPITYRGWKDRDSRGRK